MPEAKCNECGRVCVSMQRLSQHQRCHVKKHACLERQCAGKEVRFGTKRDLKRHQQTHKGTLGDTSSAEQLCPFCKLPLGKGRQDNLARHIKRQHKDQLFVAAANGDETTVKALLETGANVDQTSTRNETSLHLASRNGHTSIAILLLDYGANFESTDSRSLTSLHHAIINGHEEIAKLLLLRLSIANTPKLGAGKNLLLFASEKGCASVIDALLVHGADIESKSTKNDWTPLMFASSKAHTECVRLLVQKKANVAVRCKRTGRTLLHLAAENEKLDSIEVMSILLSAGADVEAKDRNKQLGNHSRTPLHYAANQGSFEKVQLLLAAGANIDPTDSFKRSPLFYALESRDLATVSLFLQNGASTHLKVMFRNNTILHHAADTSSVEIVGFLLENADFTNISSTNSYGETPLHLARDRDIAQVLIQKGADVRSTSRGGKTPLHYARDSQIAQLLIDHGADVNARSNNGDTPLHRTKDIDVAKLLIVHGADVGSKNMAGRTPLHSASEWAYVDIASVLVEQPGVDINSRDDFGQTPLHSTVRATNRIADGIFYRFVQLLLHSGADAKAMDNEGDTPLHTTIRYAYRDRDLYMVKILIENGVDINTKNNEGDTPLHLAAKGLFKPTEWAQVLLRNGADPKATDEKGRTASDIAREWGNEDAANILISWENQTDETNLMEC